jgi:RNA polymerase subunit RPABC4/transcription elongation factor Spt4
MKYKVYWCKDCKLTSRDEIICRVCDEKQLEIGWVETIKEWEKKK